jgi:hypothetical protein
VNLVTNHFYRAFDFRSAGPKWGGGGGDMRSFIPNPLDCGTHMVNVDACAGLPSTPTINFGQKKIAF